MSDCDGSLSSKSEPFGIESGSEYLPPQTPGRRSLISDFDSSDGDNTTTDKNSQNNNDKSSGSGNKGKKRKGPEEHYQHSSRSGDQGLKSKKFCAFFEINTDKSSTKKNDKVAKCLPCYEQFRKIVYLKMKNAGTSGLKRHLKSKHEKLFNNEFPHENFKTVTSTSPTPSTSDASLSQSTVLNWLHSNSRQSKKNVS